MTPQEKIANHVNVYAESWWSPEIVLAANNRYGQCVS